MLAALLLGHGRGGRGRRGDGNDDDAGAAATTAPATTAAAADRKWTKVVPGGDCECADGSEFAFWERRADPTKVVFFLDGGGVCYEAATCVFTGLGTGGEANYDWSIFGEDPASEDGIFNFARADNPFLDYSFVYVPSCTGDAAPRRRHPRVLARVDRRAQRLRQRHGGARLRLRELPRRSPGRRRRQVRRVAAPVYGGLAADRLPDAQVTVFSAQSGHIPDDPDLNAEILGERWGAYANMPDWEVNKGLTARDWGIPRFSIQAGLHDPEIVLARFDYAYDREAADGAESLGLDPSKLLAAIDANEAAIEQAGVVLHSYTAPGNGHGILEWSRFYSMEVNGVKLADWVSRLIEGEPVDDVHCQRCRVG